MNVYLKEFLKRGMAFGGFGPIAAGIVYFAISCFVEDFSLGGGEVLLAIASTYILAFVQAGASVFNQIESWPLAKSLGVHFLTIFLAYSGCYILNSWIPFEPMVLVIFAGIFILIYAVIWLTVYLAIRAASRKMNGAL